MMKDQEKIQTVEKILAAWSRRDFEAVADLFTEDGILHSVMMEPIVGRDTIYKYLLKLTSAQSDNTVDIQVNHIGVIDGLVFTERLDTLVINGKAGGVPSVGIFEVKEGKIDLWREFYDRATMLRARQNDESND